jgi:hypothetical protein
LKQLAAAGRENAVPAAAIVQSVIVQGGETAGPGVAAGPVYLGQVIGPPHGEATKIAH